MQIDIRLGMAPQQVLGLGLGIAPMQIGIDFSTASVVHGPYSIVFDDID